MLWEEFMKGVSVIFLQPVSFAHCVQKTLTFAEVWIDSFHTNHVNLETKYIQYHFAWNDLCLLCVLLYGILLLTRNFKT